jgi:hypothetical protein
VLFTCAHLQVMRVSAAISVTASLQHHAEFAYGTALHCYIIAVHCTPAFAVARRTALQWCACVTACMCVLTQSKQLACYTCL